MKTIFDITDDNLDDILTQFNEYEYSSAISLICMCVEEYCVAHKLDATEVFEDMLTANRGAVSLFGKYEG